MIEKRKIPVTQHAAGKDESKFEWGFKNELQQIISPTLSIPDVHTSDPSSNALVSVESGQMNEQIKSMMTHKMAADSQTFSAWTCNVCGKEDRYKSHIESHIEANHITNNVSYSCDICGKTSRSKTGLRFHKARHHST